jgi:hypothetical protein
VPNRLDKRRSTSTSGRHPGISVRHSDSPPAKHDRSGSCARVSNGGPLRRIACQTPAAETLSPPNPYYKQRYLARLMLWYVAAYSLASCKSFCESGGDARFRSRICDILCAESSCRPFEVPLSVYWCNRVRTTRSRMLRHEKGYYETIRHFTRNYEFVRRLHETVSDSG